MLTLTYLKNRFFYAIALCVVLFLLAYSFPSLLLIAKLSLLLIFFILFVDWYVLFRKKTKIKILRKVRSKLGLSDPANIIYTIINDSQSTVYCEVIDELPEQLQDRDFNKSFTLSPNEEYTFSYEIRPVIRGEYDFGELQVFISNPVISFLDRKITIESGEQVAVIPSVDQMKKYELQVFSRTASLSGIRKIRRIGENDEFEHIRAYSQGDHIKSINWKATSRKNQLMINQYQDSRSQLVYCIIDKGRSMKMPFHELTLLDYAINTCLAVSNIVLKKYDKVGLISFAQKIDTRIKASVNKYQLQKIAEGLYNEKTDFKESNFELLYYNIKKLITRRSIILFFTNFEHESDLDRSLSYLRAINKTHLLVVISFINSELKESAAINCESTSDIYFKTIAEKSIIEKEKIMQKLNANHIQTILTKPEDLSLQVINKYLEIKAKRLS